VIDLRTGNTAHWVRLEGMVSELYDVAVLPDVTQATMLGFKTNESQKIIAIGDAGNL
jgi:hypothetical protein